MNGRMSHKFRKLQSLCYDSSYIVRRPASLFFKKSIRNASSTVERDLTEKGSKDIIRVAAIYAMCGTAASYLDMMYNGKVFILKWTVPQPERFLLCAFGWGIAGCVSWLLFWSRSNILVRAAAARVRYGIIDGSRTSIIALGTTSGVIGLFSVYFDYINYRTKRTQYQATMTPSYDFAENGGSGGIGSPSGVLPPTDPIFDEDNDNSDELMSDNNTEDEEISDSMILGESANNILIQSKIPKTNHVMSSKKEKSKNGMMDKPQWNWDTVLSNVYSPCKVFWQCNAPIWLIFGTFTGVVTARLMTHSVLTQGVTAALGTQLISQTNENENENEMKQIENNCCQLLETNENNQFENCHQKRPKQIELIRLELP